VADFGFSGEPVVRVLELYYTNTKGAYFRCLHAFKQKKRLGFRASITFFFS